MNIILYKTSTCPWCKKTQEFLDKHKIKYKVLNVQEDKAALKEMIEKSGQMGVPVIDIDGEIIVGYDEDMLKESLHIK